MDLRLQLKREGEEGLAHIPLALAILRYTERTDIQRVVEVERGLGREGGQHTVTCTDLQSINSYRLSHIIAARSENQDETPTSGISTVQRMCLSFTNLSHGSWKYFGYLHGAMTCEHVTNTGDCPVALATQKAVPLERISYSAIPYHTYRSEARQHQEPGLCPLRRFSG